MFQDTNTRISDAIHHSFIDKDFERYDERYTAKLLINDSERGQKLQSIIERELLQCNEFAFSVAFITTGGMAGLLQTLLELKNRNIKGRILTTDYLNVTEPQALRKLLEYPNIEVRFFETTPNQGFHTKGYIFDEPDAIKIIVGSSNFTGKALAVNKEWNMLFVTTHQGAVAQNIADQFNELWKHPFTVKLTEEVIDRYQERYKANRQAKQKSVDKVAEDTQTYVPNSMQQQFINSLNTLVLHKQTKALLLSATGTGKTFAAAFAMRDLVNEPRRVLFLVHREQIAKQAMETFEKIFKKGKTFGLLSGSHKDISADFLFATMQTMSKEDSLRQFAPDVFDVIIIDEAHRAGSKSYREKIMKHFAPKLWLGMTASPSRTDGIDVYSLFDHNIAHEISLKQALETDLLCPFHYFGITDLDLGESLEDPEFRDFNKLTSQARVDHILEKARYFGHSGERLKGLIFCSRNDEAQELARVMRTKGIRCESLSGADSQDKRKEAIDRLESDDTQDPLDYIITVDIFNEGIDIPQVNQIIMLRPTQSPVIFVQQLGRGLRKAKNKGFLVVLDFIGNYQNNYMIPVALSSDRTYNKDYLRRIVATGNSVIAGESTIHFDEVARKRIYDSIDKAKTNDTKLIRQAYEDLKFKLGKIPSVHDFVENGAIDPIKIFDKFGSYYTFLNKYEPDFEAKGQLTSDQELMLQWVSQKFAKGKRCDELHLIADLVAQAQSNVNKPIDYIKWVNEVALRVGFKTNSNKINCQGRILKGDFNSSKQAHLAFLRELENGLFESDSQFVSWIQTNRYFRDLLNETLSFGLRRNQDQYEKLYKDTDFVLYEKYTYEDVQRLLGWNRNMNAQNIGGYFYEKETKTLPVFINYEKADDAIAYEDRFISPSELIALSKHPRTKNSPDADHMFKRTEEDKDNRIFLFVRKNKDDHEAKEFYFLGEMNAHGEPEEVTMPATKDTAFEIHYKLDKPVRDDIYQYITEG